jgi:hypothetical protein
VSRRRLRESIPERIVLTLPEPPSVNRNSKQAHRYSAARERNAYKAHVWTAACRQLAPFVEPPAYVRIDAELRLFGLRDRDNAWSSLKWALDALRQKQRQSVPAYRHGLYLGRGFFIDDDDAHLGLVPPTQRIERGNRGLTLTITPCEPGSVPSYHDLEAEVERLRAEVARMRRVA